MKTKKFLKTAQLINWWSTIIAIFSIVTATPNTNMNIMIQFHKNTETKHILTESWTRSLKYTVSSRWPDLKKTIPYYSYLFYTQGQEHLSRSRSKWSTYNAMERHLTIMYKDANQFSKSVILCFRQSTQGKVYESKNPKAYFYYNRTTNTVW